MTRWTPIDDLRAEARYHRERYDLYRAKVYGMRPTSAGRLRELERAHHRAEARLRHAELEREITLKAAAGGVGTKPQS